RWLVYFARAESCIISSTLQRSHCRPPGRARPTRRESAGVGGTDRRNSATARATCSGGSPDLGSHFAERLHRKRRMGDSAVVGNPACRGLISLVPVCSRGHVVWNETVCVPA